MTQFIKLSLGTDRKEVLKLIFSENPTLKKFFDSNLKFENALTKLKQFFTNELENRPEVKSFYENMASGRENFNKLEWTDFALIRIMDYLEHEGNEFDDLNLRGKRIKSEPFRQLWNAYKTGESKANIYFLKDFLNLFRQFTGENQRPEITHELVKEWMERHPSGLDEKVVAQREKNKRRILKVIIDKIDSGNIKNAKYNFDSENSSEEKMETALKWWDDMWFHLKFAIREPDLLNEMLDNSLDEETMQVLWDARKAGIPIFVNPYYLSLLDVGETGYAKGADLAIRDYILYSKELIEEFGHIVAWEKEDDVEPDKPNAAGWILPNDHNIHRRYPEVAILIPDTIGRACGGLCSSCQRMYDFQNGRLNFNLDKLAPKESWEEKLEKLMDYYENDSRLRDILLTGGDALMSQNNSLRKILNAIYEMALRKKEANKSREKKYAEIMRIRLGTRLPVYLPQRINEELIEILSDFKNKAAAIGMKQFVVQTHFETAMEITPEAKRGIEMLRSAGWIVTNQQVFTASASRRGHTAKLRKALNETGVLPYYTFSVKGYLENKHNFATNERAVQEQIEEKAFGIIPTEEFEAFRKFPEDAPNLTKNIANLMNKHNLPFLATDRNVLNLPGVGKSLTFRTIGITNDGRRILEFDHDHTRTHSPIIEQLGKVVIIESKSVTEYLEQIAGMGEDVNDYRGIYGYSIGETEPRMPVYEYPEYDFELTDEITNIEIEDCVYA